MLLASYPNSVPTDQEGYISLVMAVFMEYSPDLVKKAVAPSGIPFDVNKFLPTTGEIEKWLGSKKVHTDRMAKYKALPPPVYMSQAPRFEPNLFVPRDVPDYDMVLEYVKTADPKNWRFEKDHVCHDGRIESGYWVYAHWWDQRHGTKKAQKKAAPAGTALDLNDMRLSPGALQSIRLKDQQSGLPDDRPAEGA